MLLVGCSFSSPEPEYVIPNGFDKSLLEIMVCPENHTELRFANKNELITLNKDIVSGKIKLRSGNTFSNKVTALLIRKDNKLGYRFNGPVPIMLIEEGIVLE